MVKIFGAFFVLLLLVCGSGLLAHHFIATPPSVHSPVVTLPLPKPPAPVGEITPSVPRYEVFPDNSLPPAPVNKRSQSSGKRPPLVAIIVDDLGYDSQITTQLFSLDAPLTFSILPYGPYSQKLAAEARAVGHEIMLHLPMEPKEFPKVDPGPGALLSQMTPDELIGQLSDHLDRFVGLKGVNNHMGSKLSSSSQQMRQIFSILKKRGLYYIDSRTSADTVARSSAQLLQLPFAERDVFIDHFNNEAFIRSQLRLLIKRARHQGYAVGIAHPYPLTIQILAEMLPQLQQTVELVPASMVVEAEMRAHLESTHAER